jgi:hypothetical protein
VGVRLICELIARERGGKMEGKEWRGERRV